MRFFFLSVALVVGCGQGGGGLDLRGNADVVAPGVDLPVLELTAADGGNGDSVGEVAIHDAGQDSANAADMVPDQIQVLDMESELVPDVESDAVSEVVADPVPWRSELYPEDWVPGFADNEGRMLHDFSFAGYHNSELQLPKPGELAPTVTVVDADNTGESDSTSAIQAALDEATVAGGVVLLPAGLYRVDGLLSVSGSNVVLRGEGAEQTKIFFTRHEGMTGKGHLTFSGSVKVAAETFLVGEASPFELVVGVEDASEFAVGDDVSLGWIITDEFIAEHGMTGTWVAFNGTWQPFYRRNVTAVDTAVVPHLVTLDVPLRYPAKLRDGASLRKETGYLTEVGVADLSLATAVGWDEAWANERTHALAFLSAKDSWVQGVGTFTSPLAPAEGPGAGAHLQNGGIKIHASKRVTVANSAMEQAQNRGGGGCGYLFEIRVSSEILTRDCVGLNGRHNFIQNWGFGTTGCVWLRCHSEGGLTVALKDFPEFGGLGFSEFHHSLATANLMDSNVVHDGWKAANRNDWSTGAGHTATQNVFWNMQGPGEVVSRQFGWGYLIGSGPETTVRTNLGGGFEEGKGTEPEDWLEGEGLAPSLVPQSLFEDQLARRLE
jgi:hypothetical protein